ncbi:MAG: maltose alpha-D-glucosyltransferase [Spirochaetae bacterium HGW-Spirochaetae-5]|nr:MAG: maltose alpha-D-glucosyltransferase [Spirochaetae bacterium HGW-Spirochaetae-5]
MDNLWYKNAVIYELSIKAFKDSSSDGKGDIPGLISKLDYLCWLGINCIWMLPIYPSPGLDDGYDISDYYSIDPAYGTMDDFKELIAQAHLRGIRIIGELVLNHTSDRHPWFLDAKKGPESEYHNYYVWSDTYKKYEDARIIFSDTERSNWTWCDECGKYYWHRFFSSQPDLNFENEKVREEMKRVFRFWFELGLDGFRVDAVPYLFEREGTDCENLPETHQYIRELRKIIDEEYPDRILLAEANQWPEDLIKYFGDGDEFHMAFNFPLMPRIFMAFQKENSEPIINIIKQIPDIPSNCQWAVFLRNHDELTLEMCTDEERDDMYNLYAKDKRMQINMGIRRRLNPLLDNDRRKVELAYALLFTLPGTPVIYYGDEIGMGDNIYLGDRNGVRTPMQWNEDRNAGFSDSKPSMLYSPVIIDPEYNYNAVNVEAQVSSPSSLLSFIKRLINKSKSHMVFGNGYIDFIETNNKKILAYIRFDNEEKALCVFNLSSKAEAVKLDLQEYTGLTPVELLGGSAFPVIPENENYIITLSHHSFLIFMLEQRDNS